MLTFLFTHSFNYPFICHVAYLSIHPPTHPSVRLFHYLCIIYPFRILHMLSDLFISSFIHPSIIFDYLLPIYSTFFFLLFIQRSIRASIISSNLLFLPEGRSILIFPYLFIHSLTMMRWGKEEMDNFWIAKQLHITRNSTSDKCSRTKGETADVGGLMKINEWILLKWIWRKYTKRGMTPKKEYFFFVTLLEIISNVSS